MREDQVMQSIMRFGRDEKGAVVFAHTAALRKDLPVVDHADVVEGWASNQKAVARAAKELSGGAFTVSDVFKDDRVDCSRRTVRRLLNEFADLGYMHRRSGHTNAYRVQEDLGAGEVELPTVDSGIGAESGQTDLENMNTAFVWSSDTTPTHPIRTQSPTTTLGPPVTVEDGPPPG